MLPLQNWASALLWAGLGAWTRGDKLRHSLCLNSWSTCPVGKAQGISFPFFPQYFFKEVCGTESQHKPDRDTWVFSSFTEPNNPGITAKRPWNNNKNPQTKKTLKPRSSAFAPGPFKDCFYSCPFFTFGSHQKFLFCMVKKIHAYTNVNIWVVGSLLLANLMLSLKQERWQFCPGWSPVILVSFIQLLRTWLTIPVHAWWVT